MLVVGSPINSHEFDEKGRNRTVLLHIGKRADLSIIIILVMFGVLNYIQGFKKLFQQLDLGYTAEEELRI